MTSYVSGVVLRPQTAGQTLASEERHRFSDDSCCVRPSNVEQGCLGARSTRLQARWPRCCGDSGHGEDAGQGCATDAHL